MTLRAHGIAKGVLNEAIDNVDNTREFLKSLQCPIEAELMYQTRQLLREINQYFEGGYLAPDYIEEKCNNIKHQANMMYDLTFGNEMEVIEE